MAESRLRTALLQALHEFAERGYTSEADLHEWLIRLHAILERELPSDDETRRQLEDALDTVFRREIDRGGIQKRVPGVERYTLDRIAHELRAELDRRVYAGVDLIKLNKAAATQKTLQRFSGWVTSVPPGRKPGKLELRKAAREILKPTAQLKFERRRVAIDQGHKLASSVAHVVAMGNGAIAGIWHDRGQFDRGYDARPEHLARSGKLFVVRDSWALDQGLIKKSGVKYTDEIEQPAELVYCSCWYEYITHPRDLPENMLTAKGRAWLEWGRRHDAVVRTDPSLAARDVNIDPTPAQIEAGNYAKGHVRVQGLDITIENPKGGVRRGVGPDGQPWSVEMPAHYGYLKRTTGADSEQLDCYIGPAPDAKRVWVIDQVDVGTKQFDEHKVMLGFPNRHEALETYKRGFSDGRGSERIGRVRVMDIEQFKRWIATAA